MSGFLSLGPLAFANPLLLAALVGLPVLWWLLRATPPAPVRERFPGVAILLGLEPPEKTPMRTPWWLLLLRLIIAALVILAFAEPLLNPRDRLAASEGPVRLVVDAGWPSAPDWEDRLAAARDTLDQAERAGRSVMLITPGTDTAKTLETRTADDWRGMLDVLTPAPWAPGRMISTLPEEAAGETVWLHDGLDHGGAEEFAAALAALGPLRAIGPERTIHALRAGREDGALAGTVLRAAPGPEETVRVIAFAAGDDGGAGRPTAGAEATFAAGETTAIARFDAPLEVLNAIGVLALEDGRTAGGTVILDDSFRRKRLGLVSGERSLTDQVLLSGTHYLREAVRDVVELRETTLTALMEDDARMLDALDALALIDIGALTGNETEILTAWVEAGGTLIRFAGPALAAATDDRAGFGRADDPLLPVRLRPGGRDLGGAMSWGEPQRIAPFEAESPFHGLPAPDDATVSRQVLAQPDVDLPARTWARLQDGSPLVTADTRGEGRVVLFHVGADPRWSSLPLSGLFPSMIERVIDRAAGIGGASAAPELLDALWSPVALLDAAGALTPAPQTAPTVQGARLADGGAGPDAPPGLYEARDTRVALNVIGPEATLMPMPTLPDGTQVSTLGTRAETALKPLLLTAALILLALDAIAALWATGKLRRPVAAALVLFLAHPAEALEEQAMRAALDGSLGYVVTGDATIDRVSRAGLYGLGRVLTERTSVEPADPVAVDLEVNELSVYPLLYWPATAAQPTPSPPAIARLNDYLRNGGMILFDTRDQHLSVGGAETPGQRELRRLAAGLDLPPLAPVDPAHVLTRSFYLLDDFPGRHEGGALWVEAVPTRDELDDARDKGFSNDGVSPVLVGGRDWSGAWALDESGRPLLPVAGGATQREMAFRFGVNLVMYAYTGSYKSDQVHVPALLDRLGR